MEEKFKNHLVLFDRKCLRVDGVEHVGAFDEYEISLDTNMGFLLIKGEGLHITGLNLEEGNLTVEGFIASMSFIEGRTAKGIKEKSKNVLGRIFR